MQIKTDAKVGETYVFPQEEQDRLYQLKAITPKGKLILLSGKLRKSIGCAAFDQMRGDGRAKRIHRTGITERGVLPRALDPRLFVDPIEGAKNFGEITRRRRAIRKLEDARTLYFYVKRLAESPGVTCHVPVLTAFIDESYPDAEADGLYWKPSYSALMRVIRKHGGKPEGITLAAILDKRGSHSPEEHWEEPVVKMRRKVIAFYWSSRVPPCNKIEAQAYFFAPLIRLNRRRRRVGATPYGLPVPQTVSNWIDEAISAENVAKRQGVNEARRKVGGRKRSAEANRALELVLMDNTQVDVWAAVRSSDGRIIGFVRPWLTLAVDVYSRMILGAHLSLDQASMDSAFECLKQVVRRKEHLIKRFPECSEAADCWGRVGNLIVDNGLDFASLSFRVACEYAGISLRFAPVRTPEYKGIVERTFGTLNTSLWHRLPGGIPDTPQERSRKRMDPRDDACFTLEELDYRMWGTIVPILGTKPHSQTGVAPARRFFQSIRDHGRPTVDDVDAFDAILGQTKRCLLTAEGIRFDNQRFHDPALTGGLLADLLSEAEKRGQRKSGSSNSVWVWAVKHREDCSYANVYNTKRKDVVALPNWDPDIGPMTSYTEAEMRKAHTDAENEQYYSRDDQWLARDKQRRSREVGARELKSRKQRDRSADAPAGAMSLEEGSIVQHRTVAASVSGSRPVEVPGGMPIHERTDNLVPPKDSPRGGTSSRKKAHKAKAVKELRSEEQGSALNALSPIRPSKFRIADPAAFMADLKKNG